MRGSRRGTAGASPPGCEALPPRTDGLSAARQAVVARGRLGSVGGVQLAQDVLDVELHRALGEHQLPGDVRVREAAGHVLEHVDLTPREDVAQAALAAAAAERRLAPALR